MRIYVYLDLFTRSCSCVIKYVVSTRRLIYAKYYMIEYRICNESKLTLNDDTIYD